MIRRNSLLLGFLAGIMTTVGMTIVLSGNHATSRAMGQVGPPPVGETARKTPVARTTEPAIVGAEAPLAARSPRYQIATWSNPGAIRDTGGFIAPSHGAYVLDTESGDVWQVDESRRPKPIGRIGKVGPD